MRLARVGPVGAERPVALAGDQTAFDLSGLVVDLDRGFWARRDEVAAAVRSGDLPRVDVTGRRFGACVPRPGKIVCIGLNYADHARETGAAPPAEPVLFLKDPSTVIGPEDVVRIPPGSVKTDYEVELAVVIGREALYLADRGAASACIGGYALVNDLSERAYQLERGGQWDKGKCCPTFNPLGPYLVTADALDVTDLPMRLEVNGEPRQTSSTAQMLFDPAHLVWYVSQFMRLEPGDVLNTGTPAGVALARGDVSYLRPGDVVTAAVPGLGEQTLKVEATP